MLQLRPLRIPYPSHSLCPHLHAAAPLRVRVAVINSAGLWELLTMREIYAANGRSAVQRCPAWEGPCGTNDK